MAISTCESVYTHTHTIRMMQFHSNARMLYTATVPPRALRLQIIAIVIIIIFVFDLVQQFICAAALQLNAFCNWIRRTDQEQNAQYHWNGDVRPIYYHLHIWNWYEATFKITMQMNRCINVFSRIFREKKFSVFPSKFYFSHSQSAPVTKFGCDERETIKKWTKLRIWDA